MDEDLDESLSAEERRIAVHGLEIEAMKFAKRSGAPVATDIQDDIDMESGEEKGAKRKKTAPKRKTKKEKEFDIKVAICEQVKVHPELYQINHTDYHNKEMKEAIWQKVCEAVAISTKATITVADCKKFWTALKESTR